MMIKEFYIMNGKQRDGNTIRQAMKKYLTNKGKITRAKYLELHKEKIRNYNIKYQSNSRMFRLKNRLCLVCANKLVPEEYFKTCAGCRERIKLNIIKRRNEVK